MSFFTGGPLYLVIKTTLGAREKKRIKKKGGAEEKQLFKLSFVETG